jgi:alpha-glucosidase
VSKRQAWWEKGTIYQIVPQSFMDSDGDGTGDLEGIRSRLDHLSWLGVDAVWLGPIYPSPCADFGYDISDYRGVHPQYGSLEDFERLVAEVHERGMKLILDFVPNHTSDQHPWFAESRSSLNSSKRDWYIWRDPGPGGGPPNNWLSVFGGSAWTLDLETGQYYFHSFTEQEVDLNWRNPYVQEEMMAAMRWWLERGVDGYRIDAPWYMVKDRRFRHNPPFPGWDGERQHEQQTPAFSRDLPEGHELMRMMRRTVDAFDERLLMGEFYLPPERLVSYYGAYGDELHFPCNYQLLTTEWTPQALCETVSKYEGLLQPVNWPSWALGNHDMSRTRTRIGPEQARVAVVLLLTLRGTPLIYFGEEIGMEDVPKAAEAQRDPQTRDYPPGNRMPYRTPMQWSDTPNAGFTTGSPWLPISENVRTCNVEAQRRDPGSLLNLYRRLLALRRSEAALHSGDFIPLPPTGDLLPYLREFDGTRILVVLNMGGEEVTYRSEWVDVRGRICAATGLAREDERVEGHVALEGNEAVVIQLT